jgi:hypothetical protein
MIIQQNNLATFWVHTRYEFFKNKINKILLIFLELIIKSSDWKKKNLQKLW